MSDKFKIGQKVYYHNPKGDTIPTIVTRVGWGRRVKLRHINIEMKLCGHRKGWVPESRVEAQDGFGLYEN